MRPPEAFGIDEVVRFLMTTFRTYDIRHVNRSYMNKLYPEAQAFGLTNLKKRKIYLMKDLQNGDHDRVFLHELAHVYKDGIVGDNASEDDIWHLSTAWLRTIYGLQ